jgi:hypothetical protein
VNRRAIWPATLYFKDSGRRVPILDIEALTEAEERFPRPAFPRFAFSIRPVLVGTFREANWHGQRGPMPNRETLNAKR